jgi:hypothetical protein
VSSPTKTDRHSNPTREPQRQVPWGARLLAVLALLLSQPGGAPAVQGLDTSCHIHPPTSAATARPAIVGPFADLARCEAERIARYGDQGRCHCTAGFAAPWRGARSPETFPESIPEMPLP